MTSNDLKEFSIMKKWTNARIKFLQEQKETINRLNSVLSDMPKGSRQVEDMEAESLTRLLDQIDALRDQIERRAIEAEEKIKMQLSELDSKHGLLLYHHYILGDSIKYIAKEILHYREKYVYDLKNEALKKFDEVQEKKGRFRN